MELVGRSHEQFWAVPNSMDRLADVCGDRPTLGDVFHVLAYMARSTHSFGDMDTFLASRGINHWHCVSTLLGHGDGAARLEAIVRLECTLDSLVLRLLELEHGRGRQSEAV